MCMEEKFQLLALKNTLNSDKKIIKQVDFHWKYMLILHLLADFSLVLRKISTFLAIYRRCPKSEPACCDKRNHTLINKSTHSFLNYTTCCLTVCLSEQLQKLSFSALKRVVFCMWIQTCASANIKSKKANRKLDWLIAQSAGGGGGGAVKCGVVWHTKRQSSVWVCVYLCVCVHPTPLCLSDIPLSYLIPAQEL